MVRMKASEKKSAKLKHINACLLDESQYKKTAGFERFELNHQSLPEISLDDISCETIFLEHKFSAPLMIAPMTGGVVLGQILNERWAKAAEYFGIGLGVGSQRLALEDDAVKKTFLVRKYAKNAFIFANLGAVQLAKWGPSKALEAVKMIEADAIFIHLNPLQEVCQENGDTNFGGILNALEKLNNHFASQKIPVLAREVGFGLSKESSQKLLAMGISGIDCAGAGGTSWSKVESLCSGNQKYKILGECFSEVGIKTVDSIQNVRSISKDIPLIATGGIRSGIDIFKALALGAHLASIGQPMLKAAISSEKELFDYVEQILLQFKIAMLTTGTLTVEKIGPNSLIKV